jgi:hypothetical protein
MPRWDAVDGLVRELGALRAESFALEREHLDAAVLAEVERIIASAVDAIEPTLDAPEDPDRLTAACEVIVTARARIEALRDTAARSQLIAERGRELRENAGRLYERISGAAGRSRAGGV